MYKFYNAHPKGLRVGDCVKRAISKACDMDYHDVSLALNRYKKVTGATKFNTDRNPEKWLENVAKAKRMSFPAKRGCVRMNGERFCKAYPKGRYVLQMAGHLTACVDGVIYDTWDCSEKCVYKAWEIKPEVKQYAVTINYRTESDSDKQTIEKAINKLIKQFISGVEGLTVSVEEV